MKSACGEESWGVGWVCRLEPKVTALLWSRF